MTERVETIYLDADACPVKEYVFRVAARYTVPLVVVANTPIRIPDERGLSARLVVVPDSPDAADDWIVENAVKGDLVLTADIPLAARVIGNGVDALDFRGGAYNPNRIGDAVASRDLNAHLRSVGLVTGGPSAFSQKDRSKFASTLDAAVGKMKRRAERRGI
ncbi:MAG TPA: YaiI/YqxD family protein [Thermomicrobiales bacterium]|nr:YaiI/YqxD family protein [Thermomicrobiales bacterium]